MILKFLQRGVEEPVECAHGHANLVAAHPHAPWSPGVGECVCKILDNGTRVRLALPLCCSHMGFSPMRLTELTELPGVGGGG